MMLGGRVAEEIIFGDFTGGASNDIERSTAIARKMVTVYGMSKELGTIRYGSRHGDEVFLGRDFGSAPDYSDSTAAKIDAEIKKIIDESYALAKQLLIENQEKLDFIADFLLKYEVMDEEQFLCAMKKGAKMEELDDMVAEKRRRSEEENKKRREKMDNERIAHAKAILEERKRLEAALGLVDDEAEQATAESLEQNSNDSENAAQSVDNFCTEANAENNGEASVGEEASSENKETQTETLENNEASCENHNENSDGKQY